MKSYIWKFLQYLLLLSDLAYYWGAPMWCNGSWNRRRSKYFQSKSVWSFNVTMACFLLIFCIFFSTWIYLNLLKLSSFLLESHIFLDLHALFEMIVSVVAHEVCSIGSSPLHPNKPAFLLLTLIQLLPEGKQLEMMEPQLLNQVSAPSFTSLSPNCAHLHLNSPCLHI